MTPIPTELRELLERIVAGDVGRMIYAKLATGQATETDDGKAWLELRALLATHPADAADMGWQAGKEVGEPMQVFACQGKGGEYVKLGYAKPAGAIKTIQGDSGLMVYMDTANKQLYFRDPTDFRQRMVPLGTVEPCSLGGDLIRQMTLADILAKHRQQAGKLAEALRKLTAAMACHDATPEEYNALAGAREALADWEKNKPA